MRNSVHSVSSMGSRKRGISLSLKGQTTDRPNKQIQQPRNSTPNIIQNRYPPAKVKFIGKPIISPQSLIQPIKYGPPPQIFSKNQPPIQFKPLQHFYPQNFHQNSSINQYQRKKQQQILRNNLKRQLNQLTNSIKQKQQLLETHKKHSIKIVKQQSQNSTPYNQLNNNIAQCISHSTQISPRNIVNQKQQKITVNVFAAKQKKCVKESNIQQIIQQEYESPQKVIKQFTAINTSPVKTIQSPAKKILINQTTIKQMKNKSFKIIQDKQNSRKQLRKTKNNTRNNKCDNSIFEQLQTKLDRLINMTAR